MIKEDNKKAQKRAWDSESDRMLVELISDIGPRQWELIAEAIPKRSGKQCRERWNNQLNPLLKKTAWSLEEGWILFILQRSAMNRWAEISNVILGRPDNSIKNYWNSVFRHKQRELSEKLDKYLNQSLELDLPEDQCAAKKDILKRLLKHFVRQA